MKTYGGRVYCPGRGAKNLSRLNSLLTYISGKDWNLYFNSDVLIALNTYMDNTLYVEKSIKNTMHSQKQLEDRDALKKKLENVQDELNDLKIHLEIREHELAIAMLRLKLATKI
jgi:hypothetical protein